MLSLDDEEREAILHDIRSALNLTDTELWYDDRYNERVLGLITDQPRSNEWWQVTIEAVRNRIGVGSVSMQNSATAFMAFAAHVR